MYINKTHRAGDTANQNYDLSENRKRHCGRRKICVKINNNIIIFSTNYISFTIDKRQNTTKHIRTYRARLFNINYYHSPYTTH